MAQKRRDSDLSSELYFSVYGNNRKLKPQKIKAYALYKPQLENTPADNIVIAANETNEIFISFKEGLESKVFAFDKVFYNDIHQDEFYSLTKSAVCDVIMGLNSFLILSKLSYPALSEIKSSSEIDLFENIVVNMLNELFLFVNKEENMDCSLHASYFEIHEDKIIDLLNESDENISIQVYENPEKDCVEIKGLIEIPLFDNKGIDKIFARKPDDSACNATCCHLIVFLSLMSRNINADGLEFIKVGKLTLIGPARCKNNLGNANQTDDCLLTFAEKECPFSSKSMIVNILKPAFRENATTTIVVIFSSILHSLEKDLRVLQFVSRIGNSMTNPEIDLQLIIRNSTKEYAEEIKELQKDFDATSKGNGVRVDHLLYRSLKNCLALENEKVKNLDGQELRLIDSASFKKQQMINLHAALELNETEIKEVKTPSELLKLELDEMENENNIIQIVSIKADEIVEVKQLIKSNELHLKELKLELIKANRNYEELNRNIHFLKNETVLLLSDIDSQNSLHKSSLETSIADMNSAFLEFQSLGKDLAMKLKNLLDIDVLIKSWKNCTENLISEFSSEYFTFMKPETNIPLAPFCVSKEAIVDIIEHNWSEKGAVLKYYFSKLQVFCDSSFKMLAEIIHQMDMIDSCYKTKFQTISAIFSSTNEAFKRFILNINATLKTFQHNFEELEKELIKMSDIICVHKKFKKQFVEEIDGIKQSLFALKQMYLNYNDVSTSNWHELQKGCQNSSQKYNDLSGDLSLFQMEILLYLDNFPGQSFNVPEHFLSKDKTNNVEDRILQLLQIHNEMKGNLKEAVEVHKKGSDKESLEIEKYMTSRKIAIGQYFDTFSVKLKAGTSNFMDGLSRIYNISMNNKGKFEKDLDSLSLSVSYLEPIFNLYLSTSNNILTKSEQSFVTTPSAYENKNDIFDFENLFLEEWEAVTTSTPNFIERREFNVSEEKKKLIHRMKSLAEQRMLQKMNNSVLDFEEKEMKNVTTISLPSLRTHSKAPFMTEKSFPRLKLRKK